jgi:hypothetical protein
MVRFCLEMPYGGIRHFPAGTYNEQMATWLGKRELNMMSLVHSVWYMFKKMKIGDWGEGERQLAKWMMPDEKKPEEPTNRIDSLIGSLWKGSWWAYRVMLGIRAQDG